MSSRATLEVRLASSEAINKSLENCRSILNKIEEESFEGLVFWFDVHQNKAVEADIRSKLKQAENQLSSMAKKLGLTLQGAPDIAYGSYGSFRDGSLEYWYQAYAK